MSSLTHEQRILRRCRDILRTEICVYCGDTKTYP